jgi:flavin-dependent dehydrogenase
MSMPLLEELGVLEQVERLGIMKRGADFPSARPIGYQVFSFRRALNALWPHAVQIRRQDLDQLLFEAARGAAVTAIEDTEIMNVEFNTAGVRAYGTTATGHAVVYDARYLIDATGRGTLLGRLFKLKQRHKTHQSAAMYAHFSGVKRREGDDAGNISIYRLSDGWVWLIPLPNDTTSIGLVCGPNTLRHRAGDTAGFLRRTLETIPSLAERLTEAKITGHLGATGNYSYECSRLAGRHWIMVGDATAFLDPIFSSGVHLALHSAKEAASLVHNVLTSSKLEKTLQRRYTRSHRAALRRVSWFITRFNTPVMRRLFSNPRNNWRIEEAMIAMLAGDLHRDGGVGWRLRLLKVIYVITCLINFCDWVRGLKQVRRRRREIFASASQGIEH